MKARFVFSSEDCENRGGPVLIWLSGLCKRYEGAAQDDDTWGARDAGACQKFSDLGQ